MTLQGRLFTQKSGFTMLEVLTTTTIMIVMLVVAIPNFISWQDGIRLSQAARQVYTHLQQARIRAIKIGKCCTMTFNTKIGSEDYDYILYEDHNCNLEYDPDAGDVLLRKISFEELKVELDTSQGGGDGSTFAKNDEDSPSVAYKRNGLPRSNSGALGMGTVFLKSQVSEKTKKVVMASAGRVRIE